jgi:8-oxo-dGTP diphosphatase
MPVVCAIIERAGRILLARRPAGKHLALKWEFPGGKVETGEPPDAALAREIREELGCDLVVGQELDRYVHRYGPIAIEMIPFLCRLAAGSPEPHPHEHIAVAWALPTELSGYDLAAADLPLVHWLQRSAS